MAQLVGLGCAICEQRIGWVGDSCFCPVCEAPVHNACSTAALDQHAAGRCPQCAPRLPFGRSRARGGPRTRTRPDPLRVPAWLALACPLLAWLSQVFVALRVRRATADVYLSAACVQGLLLVAGFGLGVWALAARDRGSSVVAPSVIGILISAGTLLLIAALIVRDVAR